MTQSSWANLSDEEDKELTVGQSRYVYIIGLTSTSGLVEKITRTGEDIFSREFVDRKEITKRK